MKRWLPHPWMSAALFVGWLMLWRDFTALQFLAALAAAITLPHFGRLGAAPLRLRRVGLALRFTVLVLWDIVTANFAVARLVLTPRPNLHPVFLSVPLALRSEQAVALLATIVTMTPGTLSVEVGEDGPQPILYVHTLDASDPVAIIAQIKARYEAPLREMFEC
jgi:multicomponent K+:H+ antiporter subunit E